MTALALSQNRRVGARLVTGDKRSVGLDVTLALVHVPHLRDMLWTRRTLTCGVALQCSPSKERLTEYRLGELSARELAALTRIEAGVAVGWLAPLPEVFGPRRSQRIRRVDDLPRVLARVHQELVSV